MNQNTRGQEILSRAIQQHQEGQFASAESLYKQALQAEPDNSETLHLFGVLMYQMDKLELAITLMEKAIKIDPARADTHYNLANVLGDLGRLDQAIAAFKNAIKHKPDYAKAYYNMGIIFKEQSKWPAAVEAFQQAIACDKNYDKAHNNLGLAYKELAQADKAIESFRRAIACDPDCFQAYNNLGIVLKFQGKLSDAIASYSKAIRLNPNYADAFANLGIALKDGGKIVEAISAFQRAIHLDPKHSQAHFNLAGAFEEQGKTQEAIATYRRTVELDPSNDSAKHLLAALKGETPPSAPREYVKSLFDSYDSFDKHLVDKLEYRTPTLLRQALDEVLKGARKFHHIVDLGCGTGLSGLEFKNLSDRMTGMDLSPKMIQEARAKNIYSDLFVGEIIESLDKATKQYDLFIAADVFVYMGDLSDVFRAIRKLAAKEAYFLFSVESCDRNYVLRSSGRYAHSQSYIQSLADKHGMKIESAQTCGIRKEKGQWVTGNLYVLKL